jgi:cbb3-type cytochrome oxidase maturation protein
VFFGRRAFRHDAEPTQKLRWVEDRRCMGLTWISIVASLLMGGGALLVFIWAVRSQQFKSFEDVKYQVFWSDLDGTEWPGSQTTPHKTNEEQLNGSSDKIS